RPVLIDEELIVILDQELGRVARLLLGIAKGTAREYEISSKDRSPAFTDQSLTDHYRPDAVTMEIEGGIAARCPSADNDDIRGLHLHHLTRETRQNEAGQRPKTAPRWSPAIPRSGAAVAGPPQEGSLSLARLIRIASRIGASPRIPPATRTIRPSRG